MFGDGWRIVGMACPRLRGPVRNPLAHLDRHKRTWPYHPGSTPSSTPISAQEPLIVPFANRQICEIRNFLEILALCRSSYRLSCITWRFVHHVNGVVTLGKIRTFQFINERWD